MVIDRSADELTVVWVLAPLFVLLGSPVRDVTLAWFVIVPSACGVTLIETVAFPVLTSVPSEQVTVPDACEQLP